MKDLMKKRAQTVLEVSKNLKIPICEVIEATCNPEIHNEVMDLCEKLVTQEMVLSQITTH